MLLEIEGVDFMGLLAQYMMIDDQTFRELVDLEKQKFILIFGEMKIRISCLMN